MRFTLAVCFIAITGAGFAGDADEFYKKYSSLYIKSVQEEDDKLEEAKKQRNEKIEQLTKKYISVLDKILTMYTKEGKLDQALKVRQEKDKLKALLEAGKSVPAVAEKDDPSSAPKLAKFEFSNSVTLRPLSAGTKAFGNRRVRWVKIPPLPFSQYTIPEGKGGGSYKLKVEHSGYIYIASAVGENYQPWISDGWEYANAKLIHSRGALTVYRKHFRMMDKVEVKDTGSVTTVLVE